MGDNWGGEKVKELQAINSRLGELVKATIEQAQTLKELVEVLKVGQDKAEGVKANVEHSERSEGGEPYWPTKQEMKEEHSVQVKVDSPTHRKLHHTSAGVPHADLKSGAYMSGPAEEVAQVICEHAYDCLTTCPHRTAHEKNVSCSGSFFRPESCGECVEVGD